jgi:hypothetical protein
MIYLKKDPLLFEFLAHKVLQIELLGNVYRRNAIAIYDRLNSYTIRLLTDEINHEIWAGARYRRPHMHSNKILNP